MCKDYKKVVAQQLWNIANTLYGKMNADEFLVHIDFMILKKSTTKVYTNPIHCI